MNSESEKAQAFIGRLLQNPTLKGFSVLQKEEQIIQFLHVNAAQLAPTLSSAQFFPGKNWNQIFSLLISALYQVSNQELFADIDAVVTEKIDFTFIQLLKQQRGDDTTIANQLIGMTKKLLEKPDARRAFTGAYTALHFGLVNRYLDEIFARKSYIHFELTKVQRLRLGPEEIRSFIEVNLLLKPTVFLVGSTAQVPQDRATGMVQNQFAEKVLGMLKKEMRPIPESILKSAVHASVSFNDNRFIEATARLTAVLSTRSRNYQSNIKVDRGADSPDKSWFNTARRNYKFYGFDIKMLDAL
ncbi:MAG: hypothetical protein MI724_00265, partial [Spirochaetales bacterium]|nr:hypothetical protein [Spirochaetales bacterium]